MCLLSACAPQAIGDPPAEEPIVEQLRFSGRPLQNLSRVEALASLQGWTPELLDAAGDLWREAGDLDRALPYWEAASMENPSAALLRDLAAAYLELTHWDRALDTLSRYLQLDLSDADRRWASFQRGLILAVFDPPSARIDLAFARQDTAYAPIADIITEALDSQPAAALRIALAFGEAELWSHAELSIMQVSAGEGLDVTGYARMRAYLAYARARQGREALALLRYALELAPDDPQTRTFEGLYWRTRGELTTSRDAFQAAVALDPENPSLYAELAASLELLNDIDQARYWLERALAFSGGDARYQALLDALPSSQ